jgi:hypothetical protein
VDSDFPNQIGSIKVTVVYDAKNKTGKILDESGKELTTIITYWFAWIGFHPKSEVFFHDE